MTSGRAGWMRRTEQGDEPDRIPETDWIFAWRFPKRRITCATESAAFLTNHLEPPRCISSDFLPPQRC